MFRIYPKNLENQSEIVFGGIRKNLHYMDKTDRNRDLIEDIARESLIAISYGVPDAISYGVPDAISYGVPDTDRKAEISPNSINGGKTGEPLVRDSKENYISELISISYSSSDVEKVQPRGY